MNVRFSAFLLLLVFSPLAMLLAGGPNRAASGVPTTWDIAGNGPVVLHLDRGSLGQFDSLTAYGIVLQSIMAWDTIEGSFLQSEIGGFLDHNVTSAIDPLLSGGGSRTDGIVPVVYDDDGSITDAMLGAGASNSVLGFAAGVSFDGRTYVDGSVVINGKEANRGESRYVKTVTHELGHLFGLSHTQQSLLALRPHPLMYPSSGTFAEDDRRAMMLLYPDGDVPEDFGTISGRIVNPDGTPLSGVNVIAVDSATGAVYSTLSDYYSGGRFTGQPKKEGLYRLDGLPPGTYFVGVEGINAEWDGGSSIGGYDPPISAGLIRDWYNGPGEGGGMLLDDINQRTGIRVVVGEEIEGTDIVRNDTTGLYALAGFQENGTNTYGVPQTYQGVRAQSFAARFVAPESGAPALVRFRVGFGPSLRTDGDVVVTLYRNRRASEGDLPGDPVGSVSVPQEMISAYLENEIWLHNISGASFAKGEIFHVAISLDGPGRLDLEFDDSEEGEGTTYLRGSDSVWVPFPWEGSNGGVRSGALKLHLLYSSVPGGGRRILGHVNPDPLIFEPIEVNGERLDSLYIASIGTEPLQVDAVEITGPGSKSFALVDSSLFPLTVPPGTGRMIPVRFLPTAEGETQAELQLKGNVTLSALLMGNGLPLAVQSLVTLVDFGQQLLNAPRRIDTAVLYNRGDIPMVVNGYDPGSTGFRLISPSRNVIFSPGDSLRIVVEFQPTEEREYDGTVGLVFSPARDTFRIDLTGRGVTEISGVAEEGDAGLSILEAMWPNPTHDRIELLLRSDAVGRMSATLMLVDPAGRIVREEERVIEFSDGAVRIGMDLGSLPSGPYRLIIRTPDRQFSREIHLIQ